jgi:hypothetical protein
VKQQPEAKVPKKIDRREAQKVIKRYEEIHRAVQAVADHWRQLPRPR